MTITAKYPGKCSECGGSIHAGEQIEWSKGAGAKHTKCGASTVPVASAASGKCTKCGAACKPQYQTCYRCSTAGKVWVADKFNGYGAARRGGYARACKTGGNCSSFGSGRSCGAPDCDGY